MMGAFSGYFASYGSALFLPDSLQAITSRVPLIGYAFVGVYVMVVYAAVFIGLNLFLNEEKTLWLIHLLPVPITKVVWGKASSLALSFVSCIPFIAFFAAFTNGARLLLIIWLFFYGFLSGCILSIPLGAYYCGRKSDVLLLYSVSLMMFIVMGIGLIIGLSFESSGLLFSVILGLVLFFELMLLAGSVHLSSWILSLQRKVS
jgi:hypothetical protein